MSKIHSRIISFRIIFHFVLLKCYLKAISRFHYFLFVANRLNEKATLLFLCGAEHKFAVENVDGKSFC